MPVLANTTMAMLYALAPIKATKTQIVCGGSFFEESRQRPAASIVAEMMAANPVRRRAPDETLITQICVNIGNCRESNSEKETMYR